MTAPRSQEPAMPARTEGTDARTAPAAGSASLGVSGRLAAVFQSMR